MAAPIEPPAPNTSVRFPFKLDELTTITSYFLGRRMAGSGFSRPLTNVSGANGHRGLPGHSQRTRQEGREGGLGPAVVVEPLDEVGCDDLVVRAGHRQEEARSLQILGTRMVARVSPRHPLEGAGR